MNRLLFRYSQLDAIPALCVVGIVALHFATLFCWQALPWWALALAFSAVAVSYCWNLQCLSHNFVHNAFFSADWLNRVFSVLETLSIGLPQVCYHHYHLNHHKGDNDRKGPDGTTRDWSSIFRHSPDDRAESFLKYVFLGFFRVEMGPLFRTIWKHGWKEVAQTAVEIVTLGAFWLFMAWYDWRYLAFFYVPAYYLGWCMSYAEGYFEHYGAEPGNPYANSVSSYNRPYNVLWFNNGYHQEHHWDPKAHWTQMPALSNAMRDRLVANNTRMLRMPHFLAFLERYWWQPEKRPEHAEVKQSAA